MSKEQDNAWFEAFGDAVEGLGKKWPDDLTDEEFEFCEAMANKVAPRPEELDR